MKFDKLIKEVRGDLKKGDEITLPGSYETWYVGDEEGDYFNIKNVETGEEAQLSKYKLTGVKKIPILEYKTQDEKDAEITRYKEKIRILKKKMKGYKKNSRGSDTYKTLEKELERHQAALNLAQRQTPYMMIY